MVERVVRAQLPGSTLHVGHARDRPHGAVLANQFIGRVELPIDDVLLKVHGPGLVAGIDEPDFAPVVLREPPLAAVDGDGLLDRLAVGADAQAIVVVGGVQAIVQRPHQPIRLVLHVAAARAAGEPQRFLVGDAVTILVTVDVKIIGVRLADDDAVIERQHDAREQQLVREHGVLVVDAVAVGVLMPRDAAERLLLAFRVRVLHVGAHLGHVHAAIAVEGHHHGLGDVGLGEYGLEPVAGRHLHRGDAVGGREGLDERERGGSLGRGLGSGLRLRAAD